MPRNEGCVWRELRVAGFPLVHYSVQNARQEGDRVLMPRFLLLQAGFSFEHFVPSSERGLSFILFVCLFVSV